MFITFEGIDASGKSTIIDLFAKYLKDKYPNREIVITREPGGNQVPEAEAIRSLLLDNKTNISPYVEMLLFVASRRIHLEKLIWPALKSNKIVLCDRYIDSSIAYQGFGHNLNVDMISDLNNQVCENTQPDMTFFLDISISQAQERMDKIKNYKKDRFEEHQQTFYSDVIKGYQYLAQTKNNFFSIEASKDPKSVVDSIIKIFENQNKTC